jgi:hypothetical protein
MRTLFVITFPTEEFNTAVRDGTIGQKMSNILEAMKPEAVYFAERNGRRTGYVVADLADPSKIPALAEPWFLTFNAKVEFHPTMTPQDFQRADLESLGQKWG